MRLEKPNTLECFESILIIIIIVSRSSSSSSTFIVVLFEWNRLYEKAGDFEQLDNCSKVNDKWHGG